MKIIMLFIFSLLVISCSEAILDDEEFTEIYKNILTIREKENDSSQAELKIDQYLHEKEISREDFDQEFERMMLEPEKFIEILDSVRESVIRELSDINKKKIEASNKRRQSKESKTFTEKKKDKKEQ